jgi:hypothetical protein
MPFQTVVNKTLALGVPGEFYDAGPRRVTAWKLAGIAGARVGRVFTFDADGQPQLGGEGAFAGILCHPKEYVRPGLEASLAVREGSAAGLADKGRLIALTTAAAGAGEAVYYDSGTGEIAGSAAGAGLVAIPGAKFVFFSAEANELAVLELN